MGAKPRVCLFCIKTGWGGKERKMLRSGHLLFPAAPPRPARSRARPREPREPRGPERGVRDLFLSVKGKTGAAGRQIRKGGVRGSRGTAPRKKSLLSKHAFGGAAVKVFSVIEKRLPPAGWALMTAATRADITLPGLWARPAGRRALSGTNKYLLKALALNECRA